MILFLLCFLPCFFAVQTELEAFDAATSVCCNCDTEITLKEERADGKKVSCVTTNTRCHLNCLSTKNTKMCKKHFKDLAVAARLARNLTGNMMDLSEKV